MTVLKKATARLLAIFVLVGTLMGTGPDLAGAAEAETDGFISVANARDLDAIRKNLAGSYRLTADIEFTEKDFAEGGAFFHDGRCWLPIGTDEETPFTGFLDGNGHTISGLTLRAWEGERVIAGLFGFSSGTVKDLTLQDCRVEVTLSGPDSAGGMAAALMGGNIGGRVTGCSVSGTICASVRSDSFASFSAAGVAARNDGILQGCRSSADVSATVTGFSANASAAGIVASSSSYVTGTCTVSDCRNTGSVRAVASSTCAETYAAYGASAVAGGVVGYSEGQVLCCENAGAVTADVKAAVYRANAYAAGIVGRLEGYTVAANCHNSGSVTLRSEVVNGTGSLYAGGIAGQSERAPAVYCSNSAPITVAPGNRSTVYAGGILGEVLNLQFQSVCRCFNTGDLAVDTSIHESCSSYVGGIAGQAKGANLSECYNAGSVTVRGKAEDQSPLEIPVSYAGGIAGMFYQSINSCYNLGKMTVEGSFNAFSGGIAGDSEAGFAFCYFLDNMLYATGKSKWPHVRCTNAMMQQQSTFEGFDFTDVWKMGSGDYSYPLLRMPARRCGDADRDGNITTTDARLILQLAVEKIREGDLANPYDADLDGDGYITSTDARLILQKAVGKLPDPLK